MSRVSPFQSVFTSGEIAPLSYGQVEADRYKSAVATSFNGIPMLEGPWTRRGGSKYAYTAKSNVPTKMVPFKVSNTLAFTLEFGANFIRFHTRSGPVLSGGVPYEVVTPYSFADTFSLSFSQNKNTLYIANGNNRPAKLTYIANTNWLFEYIDFSDGPYALDHGSTYEGPPLVMIDLPTGGTTPFAGSTNLIGTAVAVNSIQCYQFINVGGKCALYFPVPACAWLETGDTIKLQSLTTASAYNGTWVITKNGSNSIILNGSTAPGSTLTDTGGALFDLSFVNKNISAHPNAIFRAQVGTLWHYGVINAIGNSSGPNPTEFSFQRTSLYAVPISSAITPNFYKTPLWGNFASGGLQMPTWTCFHENRLFWGGGTKRQLIVGSFVGKYETLSPTTWAANSGSDNTIITDACAVSFSLLNKEVQTTTWGVSDEKGLIVGTSGGPWIVRPSVLNEAITPINISAKQLTNYPCNTTAPAVVGKSAIYLDTAQRVVRELAYFFSIDGFRAVELSEFYNHLAAQGITTEIVYQNVPIKCVWFGRKDGTLIGITYDRTLDQLRMGWHRHTLGGASDAGGTPPVVESMCVIPSPDGTCDDLWMSVKRYVNGSTVRYIEYLSKIFEVFNRPEEAYFLDCGITQDNPIDVQAGVALAGATTFQATAHGLSTGDQVRFRDVIGFAKAAGQPSIVNDVLWTITKIDNNNFSIPLDSSALTPFVVTEAIVLGLTPRAQVRKMVTTVSGLNHLIGQTVSVIGDAADLGDYTVDNSGQVTGLTSSAGQIHAGINYYSDLKQLRLEAGSRDGTSIGKFRRINEFAVMVDRSAPFLYGPDFVNMGQIVLRQATDNMDQAVPLFSGISDSNTVNFPYDTENQLCFRQDRPLPLTLTGIMPQQVTYDKT